MKMTHALTVLITSLAAASAARAETVTIPASADTALHEFYPDHNFGGHTHMAVGATGSPKLDGSPFVTRGLIRFDLDGKLPAGALITSATVRVTVSFVPEGGASSTFALHRVLQAWGEGTNSGNMGAAAAANEATWIKRFSPAQDWTAPGASSSEDSIAEASASTAIGLAGAHELASTNLVADVQSWLAQPDSNHGWLIKTQAEQTPRTALRIASRETVTNAPVLVINYTLPGPAMLRVQIGSAADGNAAISWEGGEPPFQVVAKTNLTDTEWNSVGAAVETNRVTIPLDASRRFFRVASKPLLAEPTANYEVTFDAVWSATTHPDRYPGGAHWSGLVGGTHNAQVTFWEEGASASDGIKDMAELGSKTRLLAEVDAAISAGNANARLSGGGIGSGSGTVKLSFAISRDFPLVTLTSMLAPSPDWFVGVGGLSLIENGQWVNEKTVTLFLYDAGTDSGSSYASPNQATIPRESIRKFTTFPALVNGEIIPFGTFKFVRKP